MMTVRRFVRWSRALAVGTLCAGLVSASSAAGAASCPIEGKAEAIYGQLKHALEIKFGTDTDVRFPPYGAVHSEMKPGCLLEMTGTVDITHSRVEARKPFMAEVEPSSDATGWRIVTLKVAK